MVDGGWNRYILAVQQNITHEGHLRYSFWSSKLPQKPWHHSHNNRKWLKQPQSLFHRGIPRKSHHFLLLWYMLCMATPDSSSSSKNINSTARVSRLSLNGDYSWMVTIYELLKILSEIKAKDIKNFSQSNYILMTVQKSNNKNLSWNVILPLQFWLILKSGRISANWFKIAFHRVLVKLQTETDFNQTLSNLYGKFLISGTFAFYNMSQCSEAAVHGYSAKSSFERFQKNHRKTRMPESIFNKVAITRRAIDKKDSSRDVFLWCLCNFSEKLFSTAPLYDCSLTSFALK